MRQDRITKAFTYHPPTIAQQQKYKAIRDEARTLAFKIESFCPESSEKELAMTKLEEAVMWANASIARNE